MPVSGTSQNALGNSRFGVPAKSLHFLPDPPLNVEGLVTRLYQTVVFCMTSSRPCRFVQMSGFSYIAMQIFTKLKVSILWRGWTILKRLQASNYMTGLTLGLLYSRRRFVKASFWKALLQKVSRVLGSRMNSESCRHLGEWPLPNLILSISPFRLVFWESAAFLLEY
jgi:hypothetical protein